MAERSALRISRLVISCGARFARARRGAGISPGRLAGRGPARRAGGPRGAPPCAREGALEVAERPRRGERVIGEARLERRLDARDQLDALEAPEAEVVLEGGARLAGAMKRYETFQQKAPQRVVRVQHDPPKNVVPVGDAVAVMYRSSKWTKPGEEEEDIDYKHLHEPAEGREYAVNKGVRLFENARFADPKLKRNAGVEEVSLPAPHAWARLGYCLGFFVRRDEDGEVRESNPRNTWLLSAPDGHTLAVYSPKPQPNGDVGFLCILSGGKLRVLKEGIDG